MVDSEYIILTTNKVFIGILVTTLVAWPINHADAKTKTTTPAKLVFERGMVPAPVSEVPTQPLVIPKAKDLPKPVLAPPVQEKSVAPDTGKYQRGQKVGDGQCVTFAKKYLGQKGTWGNGGRRLPLTKTPQVGDVVVFNYTHVAVIDEIQGGNLALIEQNYELKKRVSTRTISINDKSIKGFYHP